jgi:hypothetical protein
LKFGDSSGTCLGWIEKLPDEWGAVDSLLAFWMRSYDMNLLAAIFEWWQYLLVLVLIGLVCLWWFVLRGKE